MPESPEDPQILKFPHGSSYVLPKGYDVVRAPRSNGPAQPREMSLFDAHYLMEPGDLLLFQRPGLIARAGRGIHSHAAMLSQCNGTWMCLEVRELVGGRCVTLESQVKRFPGRIDWFRADDGHRWPEFDPAGAVRAMQQYASGRYGYWNLALAALLHLPGVRLFVPANVDDQTESKWPPFCSHAITLACRHGGQVDPVRFLADRLTEPADLARSLFFSYGATLIP